MLISLVKAWKGDTAGNLIFKRNARNFNPIMATAWKKICIAEVENWCLQVNLESKSDHHARGSTSTSGFFREKDNEKSESTANPLAMR